MLDNTGQLFTHSTWSVDDMNEPTNKLIDDYNYLLYTIIDN